MKYTLKHMRQFYPVNDYFDNIIKSTTEEFNKSKDVNQSDIFITGSGKVNYSGLELMIDNNLRLDFIYQSIFSWFSIIDFITWSSNTQYAYIKLNSAESSLKMYSDILYQLLPTYVLEMNIHKSDYNNMKRTPDNKKYYDTDYKSSYWNLMFTKTFDCYKFNDDNSEDDKTITPLQLVRLMDKIIFNLYKEFGKKFKEHFNCNSIVSIDALSFKEPNNELSKYAAQPYYTFTICNNYLINCKYFDDVIYDLKTDQRNNRSFQLNIIVFPFLKEMLIINDDYTRLKSENRDTSVLKYFSIKYDTTNVTEKEFDKIILSLVQKFLDYFKERADEAIALCKERLDHKNEIKNVYEIDVMNMTLGLNSKQCILMGNILVNNLISFIDSNNERQFLYYNNFYNTKLSGDPRIVSTLSDIPVIKDKFIKTVSGENITIKRARQNYNSAVSYASNTKRHKFILIFQRYSETFYENHYDDYEREFNKKILYDEDFNLMFPSIGFVVNKVTDNDDISFTISFKKDDTLSGLDRDLCSYTLNIPFKDLNSHEKFFDIFINDDISVMQNSIMYNSKFYNPTSHQLDFEYAANQLYDNIKLYTYRNGSRRNCIYELGLNKSNKVILIQLMLQYLNRFFTSKEFLQDMINIYNNYLITIKNDIAVKKTSEDVDKWKAALDHIIDLGNNQMNKQLNNILLKDYDDLSLYMLEASFYLSDTITIRKINININI